MVVLRCAVIVDHDFGQLKCVLEDRFRVVKAHSTDPEQSPVYSIYSEHDYDRRGDSQLLEGLQMNW